MTGKRSYRDLQVWTRAMQLALKIYRLTDEFPAGARFNLTDQLRRAVISIPTNIAEGHGRGPKMFRHYLDIALGSTAEVDTLLELAHQLGFLSAAHYSPLAQEVMEIRKMLFGLRRSIPT